MVWHCLALTSDVTLDTSLLERKSMCFMSNCSAISMILELSLYNATNSHFLLCYLARGSETNDQRRRHGATTYTPAQW